MTRYKYYLIRMVQALAMSGMAMSSSVNAATPLPEADPTVHKGKSSKVLLELSFVGVDRRNIRAYLAKYRGDTVEGLFAQSWMKQEFGDAQGAIDAYTKVITDPRGWPGIRAIAATNRVYALRGLPKEQQDALENRYVTEAIGVCYKNQYLNSLSNLRSSKDDRATHLAYQKQNPALLKSQQAAYLLNEAEYQFYATKDYARARKLVDQLWRMPLSQWKGDINFATILTLKSSPKLYPQQKESERVVSDNFPNRLLTYQRGVMRNEKSEVRRATVASWCTAYSQKIFDLDRRFNRAGLIAFQFLYAEGGSGALPLYPSGGVLELMLSLWDRPRDGTQLSGQQGQQYSFTDLVRLSNTRPMVADSNWYKQKAQMYARMGQWSNAEKAMQIAAKCTFHPDERVSLIAYDWVTHVLGPRYRTITPAREHAMGLMNSVTPEGKRNLCSALGKLAFMDGDTAEAEKWYREFLKQKNASESWGQSRLDHIALLQSLQKQKVRYDAANPLEKQWREQHGNSGVSVQLNFATGSDKLPSDTGARVAPILNVLENKAYENFIFRIEGHTDSTGNDRINEPLSKRRAQSLANFLVQSKGIPHSKIEVDGFGSRRPIASNLSESGRKLNRRAELNFMGNTANPQLVATGAMVNGITTVSPDGRLMVSTNGDVWDTRTWVRLYSVKASWSSNHMRFSPDGRFLLVPHSDDILSIGLVLHAQTGELAQLIPNMSTERTMFVPRWSPDSKRITYTVGPYCYVYDISAGRYTGVAAIPGAAGSGNIMAWIKGGAGIALCGAYTSKTMYTVDCNTWQVRKWNVPYLGYVHAIASSHDARYLYIGDDRGYLVDWDTLKQTRPGLNNMWVKAQQQGVRMATHLIQVHPGNPRLVAMSGFHTNRWGIADYDAGKVRAVSQPKGVQEPKVYWGTDGRELLLSGGWVANDRARAAGAGSTTGVYRQNLRQGMDLSNQRLEFISGTSTKLKDVIAFEQSKLIVVSTGSDTSVWDVTTGLQVHQWQDGLSDVYPAHSSAPNVFYGVISQPHLQQSKVIRYDLNDYRRTEVIDLKNFKITGVSVGKDHVVIGGGPFMPSRQGSEMLSLRVLEVSTGKVVKTTQVKAATESLKYGSLSFSGFDDLELSPDGNMIAYITSWGDGYGYGTKASKLIRFWNWKTGKAVKSAEVSGGSAIGIHFDSAQKIRAWKSETWNADWVYDLQTGKWVDNLPKSTRPNHHSTTGLKEAFTADNLRVSYSSRGEIKFIRRDTGDMVVNVLKKGTDWIAFNEQGYFAASRNGTDKVFWRVGSRLLPLAALRTKFENPALLANSMKTIFSKKTVTRPVVVKPKVDPDLFSIPYTMKVVSQSGVKTKAETYTMQVEVETLTADAPEPQIAWTVNGHTGRGFKVVPAKVTPRKFVFKHEFRLSEGINVLSAALRYKGAVVMPKTATVTRQVEKPKPSSNGSIAKTHLWFFGVGVKDYKIVDQNLNYADRDVTELEKHFKSQAGKLYKEVHTKTLTNDKATVRDIKVEMNRFLRQASAQDTVVIFIAGHGVVGADQELYFVAHDSDIDEPYTGLELRDFSKFLERRPQNQKALFLMDICHSGAFGKNTSKRRGATLSADRAVKLVEQGTGTIVLASCSGRESSYENKDFRGGHGAFTAALLEGLEGKADSAAGNGDGYVFMNELTSYVSREVPKMTRGAQHPTTPKMENVRDFPIGKAR